MKPHFARFGHVSGPSPLIIPCGGADAQAYCDLSGCHEEGHARGLGRRPLHLDTAIPPSPTRRTARSVESCGPPLESSAQHKLEQPGSPTVVPDPLHLDASVQVLIQELDVQGDCTVAPGAQGVADPRRARRSDPELVEVPLDAGLVLVAVLGQDGSQAQFRCEE